MIYNSETRINIPTTGWEVNVKPVSPGEILQEEFLNPINMSPSQLAQQIQCDSKVIHKICKGHTAITAKVALSFAKVFKTTPEFWLLLQMATDLWHARNQDEKNV